MEKENVDQPSTGSLRRPAYPPEISTDKSPSPTLKETETASPVLESARLKLATSPSTASNFSPVQLSGGVFRPGLGPGIPNGATSPFRQSFSHQRNHSRNNSVSAAPSPLSPNFSSNTNARAHGRTGSMSISAPLNGTIEEDKVSHGDPNASSTAQSRRHQRIHSRNLSVFFPRPGTTPATISEDSDNYDIEEAPVTDIDSAPPRRRGNQSGDNDHRAQLKGFSFGGRNPNPMTPSSLDLNSPVASATMRRGHHHKHSLSHQFYSFMDPGGSAEIDPKDLLTAPTPALVSPWVPISPFATAAIGSKMPKTATLGGSPLSQITSQPEEIPVQPFAVSGTIGVFLLGAIVWVMGQQAGSLSTTGLGYWVVFDAMGVAIAGILPSWLSRASGSKRRMYGNARVESVALFSQSVYLMFAAIYVCKETVEHLLLSAGGDHSEGHHHHAGDEGGTKITGVVFPAFVTTLALFTILATSIYFKNHARLVNTTNTQLAPYRAMIRDGISHLRHPSTPRATTHLYDEPASLKEHLIRNPFTICPALFGISILASIAFLPQSQHRTFDLSLAAIQTVVTFNLAYRACVSLGTVLLQTAPARGLAGGRMEAFLRAMRELERHPQVLHLPAPHIWQLTPSLTSSGRNTEDAKVALVVTLELHVKPELGDDDVLELTRWAWERCVSALHFGIGSAVVEGRAEAEVTIGVVRG